MKKNRLVVVLLVVVVLDVVVLELVGALVRRHQTKVILGVVLLEKLLRQVLQVPLGERTLRLHGNP